jgi:hypothetical protein
MKEFRKLAYLFLVLSILFAVFWNLLQFIDKSFFWKILVLFSFGWFLYEMEIHWKDRKIVRKSLIIGFLLFIATFLFDYTGLVNRGYVINSSYSILSIGADPIELWLLVFFGGTAWFLNLPKKFSFAYSVADILLLAFFGTITEIMLNRYEIMTYLTVDSLNAFFTYVLVWTILHIFNYKVFK